MHAHKKLLQSFMHALRGIAFAWRGGQNFRIHVLCAAVLLILVSYLHFSLVETAFIVLMITLVIAAELLNTVLERTLDMLEPNHHPLVGAVKDMMAGVVVVFSAGALAVGVLTFIRHFSN